VGLGRYWVSGGVNRTTEIFLGGIFPGPGVPRGLGGIPGREGLNRTRSGLGRIPSREGLNQTRLQEVLSSSARPGTPPFQTRSSFVPTSTSPSRNSRRTRPPSSSLHRLYSNPTRYGTHAQNLSQPTSASTSFFYKPHGIY
jgi:hypothetical protein